MLSKDDVIFSDLKKRVFRKDLLIKVVKFEDELRKEKAEKKRLRCFFKGSRSIRKRLPQQLSGEWRAAGDSQVASVASVSRENGSEAMFDLTVIQEMLFTNGALDMEKLLCLYMLARHSFITRIRRTQVPYRQPRSESHSGSANTISNIFQNQEETEESARLEHGHTIDLSSISFLSDKIHLSKAQSDIYGFSMKKFESTVHKMPSCGSSSSRPEEHLELLVDSVLEVLCMANPAKLRCLLQMEQDDATVHRILTSHKAQCFLQQVCGGEPRYAANPVICQHAGRGVRGPANRNMPRSCFITHAHPLSAEELQLAEQRLRNAGFRIDLLEDIEQTINALWQEELTHQRSGSDSSSDAETRHSVSSPSLSNESLPVAPSMQYPALISEEKIQSHSGLPKTATMHSWQQQMVQTVPSLLSKLSTAMSSHSSAVQDKVKKDVWSAEAISSSNNRFTKGSVWPRTSGMALKDMLTTSCGMY